MRLLTPSRATTPALGASAMPAMNTSMPSSSTLDLNSVSGSGTNYTSPHGTASSMRSLLQAADCVTNAMGSLVQQLSQEAATNPANSQQALSPPGPLRADSSMSSLSQPVAPQGHALLYRQPDYDTSLSDTGWLRNRQQSRNARHLLYHHQNNYLQQQHHHQRSNSLSHRAGSGTLDSGSEGGGSCGMYSDPECDVLTAGRRGRHSGYSADTDEEEMFASYTRSYHQPRECREESQKHQPQRATCSTLAADNWSVLLLFEEWCYTLILLYCMYSCHVLHVYYTVLSFEFLIFVASRGWLLVRGRKQDNGEIEPHKKWRACWLDMHSWRSPVPSQLKKGLNGVQENLICIHCDNGWSILMIACKTQLLFFIGRPGNFLQLFSFRIY